MAVAEAAESAAAAADARAALRCCSISCCCSNCWLGRPAAIPVTPPAKLRDRVAAGVVMFLEADLGFVVAAAGAPYRTSPADCRELASAPLVPVMLLLWLSWLEGGRLSRAACCMGVIEDV